MKDDPIVAEVREAREEYAARFGFDVKAICRDLRKRQDEDGRNVVQLKPRAAGVSGTGATGKR